MLRLIRIVDDLLETVIFDVALATSRRRRIAAALASLWAIAFYGISGLLFVPAVQRVPETIDSAPYLIERTSQAFPELLQQVAKQHEILPGREADVERELAGHAPGLDRLVSRLATARPEAFAHTPDYRGLRIAAYALVARGVWHAVNNRGDAAMLQWITTLRLARLVARGPVARPANTFDGLVASAIEREALKALAWYSEWRMTVAQWALMQRELKARRADAKNLRDFMLGDRAAAVRFFERAHQNGGFAEQDLGIYLSRALLPLKHADRAAFMDEVRDRYMRAFDADVATTSGNATRARRRALETDHALVLAPFSHEHSVTRMTNLLLTCMYFDYEVAGERLETTEQLARALEKCPEPLDLEGI